MRASDFQEIYKKGRRYRGSGVNLLFLKRDDADPSQWGISVGRRFGKAVRRNRMKRLVREAIRCHKARFPVGFHFVVEILPKASTLTTAEITRAMAELLESAVGTLGVSPQKSRPRLPSP